MTSSVDPRPPGNEAGLTIKGVLLSTDTLVCSLSDGSLLSVPLSALPELLLAPRSERQQWRLVQGGLAVAWTTAVLNVQLDLETLLRDSRATRWGRTTAE